MKTLRILAVTLIFGALFITLIGSSNPEKQIHLNSAENSIILLKFKTQPNKGSQALEELNKLPEEVKKEPNFVSIKLHVDPNDDTNILLYEEWQDLAYYTGPHMETSHLTGFMANSVNFLAGEPEITFWEMEKVFE